MGGKSLLFIGYQVVSLGTFLKLTFFDHYAYTAWNWIIVVPINLLLAEIWPISDPPTVFQPLIQLT